jgi:quercetin dioxygenase-like cupin family protein
MKFYSFKPEDGQRIELYGSNLTMTRLVWSQQDTRVGCMYIGAGELVAYHQAQQPQLFLVVKGTGWVRSENNPGTEISEGLAAFWQNGEWHEAGSKTGMTAIVIESPDLGPARYLQEIPF